MINLFLGNDTDFCTDSILEHLKSCGDGRNIFIIAPDSYSYSIENKLSKIQGLGLKAEVMSFSRLAMRILGNKINKCLTPVGCTMIMTKALFSIKDKLKYYGKSLAAKGFVNEIYSSITALRNSGISVDALKTVASTMKGYSKGKTEDLAEIYNAYLGELSGKYNDPTTRLEALVKAIPYQSVVKDSIFCFVEFYAFNSVEYQVLSAIFKTAYQVNVALIDQVGGLGNQSVYPDVTCETVKKLAKDSGVAYKRINAYTVLDDFALAISNRLFDVTPIDPIEPKIKLKLFTPPTPQDEIDEVLREIAKLVRNGMRYRDICVVAGNVNDPTIDSAFEDFGIPFFKDKKAPLSDEPSIKFVLYTIKAAINNLDRNSVISLLRNPLSGVDPIESMIFENFVLRYGIDHVRFKEPFDFGDETEREIAEKVRRQLTDILITLPQSATVDRYVQLLKEHLINVGFDQRLKTFFDSFGGVGDVAERSAQVPLRLKETLRTSEELLQGFNLKLADFYDLLRSSLDSVKLSLIPSTVDSVYIGAAKDCKYENVKAMFVIGAEEGKIPQETQDGSILTAKFHNELQLRDIVVRPEVKEENKYAKFSLIEILCKPSEYLVVSCPKVAVDGSIINPSEIMSMLKSLFGVEYSTTLSHTFAELTVSEKQSVKLASYGIRNDLERLDSYRALLSNLNQEDRFKIKRIFEHRNETVIDRGKDLFLPNNKLSVSKIERYYRCPYVFFVQDGLKAKEKVSPDVQVNETGVFIHAVLEKFFMGHKKTYESYSRDRILDISTDIAESLIDSDQRLKSLRKEEGSRRVENMILEAATITADLAELSKLGSFRPFLLEVSFGDYPGAHFPPIKLDSGTILTGKIDRLDRFEKEVIAIDYKTGSVKSGLDNVYFGEKIQLYVYLNALKDSDFIPVGAFYQGLESKYGNKDFAFKGYAYKGQIKDGLDNILKLDKNFVADGKSKLLPLTIQKGKLKSNAEMSIITADEFDSVMDYTKRLLNKADGYLRQGLISPLPLEKECKYCNAKNICYEADPKVRKKYAITIEAFKNKE